MKDKSLLGIVIWTSVVLLSWGSPTFSANGQESGYRADFAYRGEFENSRLYYLETGTNLLRKSREPQTLVEITCEIALQEFAANGIWVGNLRSDGTCGDAGDPRKWVVGNFLNYQVGGGQ